MRPPTMNNYPGIPDSSPKLLEFDDTSTEGVSPLREWLRLRALVKLLDSWASERERRPDPNEPADE